VYSEFGNSVDVIISIIRPLNFDWWFAKWCDAFTVLY